MLNMIKLFHFVPKNMKGTILYPLNELKHMYPEIYAKQAEKYQGRESLMDETAGDLGKWNDVIHMSPVPPEEIIRELKKAKAKTFPWRAFVIDVEKLDLSKTRIMVTKKENGKIVDEFLPFTKENYEHNNHITDLTRQQYAEMVAAGKRPFILGGSAHVLYKGEIETKDLEIISGK